MKGINMDKQEKISIIDLFVVLLKHWKLIAVIELAALAVAVFGYFFYPVYQYNKWQKKAVLEPELGVIMVVSLTPAMGFFVPISQCGFYFRKPDIIAKALEKTNVILLPEKVSDWFFPVDGVSKDNTKIYVSRNEKLIVKEYSETGIIEFFYKSYDTEEGILFLSTLFSLGNEALQEYINSLGKSYIDVFETTVQKSDISAYEKILIKKDWGNYLLAQRVLSGTVSASTMLIKPYVVDLEGGGSSKILADFKNAYRSKALLFVLAAFLLSIFFAFFINEIVVIKNNEEAMEKIRTALKKPDKDRL
jgi:hypothetical protein